MSYSLLNTSPTENQFHEIDDRVCRDLAEVHMWLETRYDTRFHVQGFRHFSQKPENLCAIAVIGIGAVSARQARDEARVALTGLDWVFERLAQLDSYCVDPADISHYSTHEKAAALLRISQAFDS